MSEPIKVKFEDGPAEPSHVHTQQRLDGVHEFEKQRQALLFDLGQRVRPEKKREDQPEMFQ